MAAAGAGGATGDGDVGDSLFLMRSQPHSRAADRHTTTPEALFTFVTSLRGECPAYSRRDSYLRTVFCPRYANPLLSMSIPCPCGASNDPVTVPFLSIWIIDGGRTQQSDTP